MDLRIDPTKPFVTDVDGTTNGAAATSDLDRRNLVEMSNRITGETVSPHETRGDGTSDRRGKTGDKTDDLRRRSDGEIGDRSPRTSGETDVQRGMSVPETSDRHAKSDPETSGRDRTRGGRTTASTVVDPPTTFDSPRATCQCASSGRSCDRQRSQGRRLLRDRKCLNPPPRDEQR